MYGVNVTDSVNMADDWIFKYGLGWGTYYYSTGSHTVNWFQSSPNASLMPVPPEPIDEDNKAKNLVRYEHVTTDQERIKKGRYSTTTIVFEGTVEMTPAQGGDTVTLTSGMEATQFGQVT